MREMKENEPVVVNIENLKSYNPNKFIESTVNYSIIDLTDDDDGENDPG